MDRRGLLLVASVALLHCGKTDVRRAAPVASASASATVARASIAPVELLYAVPSVVAVSSRVDNPRDLPDYIVDRKPATAWNGRTGDLVGGYVAFRVPKDAHVDHVDVTVGYDRKTDTEDLFTANVRIKGVRVYRNRQLLRSVSLDPEKREPQRIPLDADGGDFKLEVSEVVAGAKKAWRELVVSEIAVWGRPGAIAHKKPTPPVVRVGGLDPSTPTVEQPKRAGSIEAACAAFEKDGKIAFDVHKAEMGSNDQGVASGTFTCAPGAPIDAAKTSFVTPLELDVVEHYGVFYGESFEGALLGAKVSGGAFVTGLRLRGRETAMYWTTDYATLSIATATASGREALVVQVVERRVTDSDGMGTPEQLHSETVTHHGTVCDLDARGQLTCRTTSTELDAKLKDEVESSPVRTTPSGEIVIDVARAKR